MIDEHLPAGWRTHQRVLAGALAGALGLPVAAGVSAERVAAFDARELVDVLWLEGTAPAPELRILVPGPRAAAPGLYRVTQDGARRPAAARLCPLSAQAHFSFDRRHLIARAVAHDGTRVEVRDPRTCRLRLSVPAPPRTFDFDATHRHLVVASRSEDGTTELRLFDARGRARGMRSTDRNVELGFEPGGRVLHNFDRAAVGERAWGAPHLRPQPEAQLAQEETAIPGSRWRWVHVGERVGLRDPAGGEHDLPPEVAHDRPLAISLDGRVLLSYRHDGRTGRLRRVDRQRSQVTEIAQGSVDSAGVSATGKAIAWVEREGDHVTVWRMIHP